MREGVRLRGLGAVAVVLVAAAVWGSSRFVHARSSVSTLFEGTLAAPVAGIWLADVPRVLVHDLRATLHERPGLARLGSDQRVVLSGDWRKAVLRGRDGERAWYQLSGGPRFFLEGEPHILVPSSGPGLLAVTGGADGAPSDLRRIGPDGAVLARVPARGVAWATQDEAGRLAFGTRSAVAIVDSPEDQATQIFSGATSRGVLSASGARLAFEHQDGGSRRLVLLSPQDPGAPSLTAQVAEGHALFDRAGTHLVHVADQEAQLFAVDGSFLPILQRPPPAGWEWRDAAFAGDGRLALSRIRAVKQPNRDPEDAANPFRPGLAEVAVELFGPATPPPAPPATVEWEVTLWNGVAPELAFAADGRLYALVWPSAFEVELP